MLVGVWLGLLWVLFYFFDHYIQSSAFTDLYHSLPYHTMGVLPSTQPVATLGSSFILSSFDVACACCVPFGWRCWGVGWPYHNRIYHAKVTSEPHCISCTDMDMGKTISTFSCYFLISFITSFSPKHFICALKKFVHNSVVPTDGAHTKVEFLNACIKRFGEKDVMNEIKK